MIVAQRGGSAFLYYDRKEECKEDFLSGEYTKVKDVRVVVMFGHNMVPPASTNKNRESRQPLVQFIKNKSRDGDGDMSELLDLLLSCDMLKLERMERQFSRFKGKKEEVELIKIKWLDTLVKRAIEKYELPESEASIYKRGDLRSLVESIWAYFESKYRYTRHRSSSSGGELRSENSRIQGQDMRSENSKIQGQDMGSENNKIQGQDMRSENSKIQGLDMGSENNKIQGQDMRSENSKIQGLDMGSENNKIQGQDMRSERSLPIDYRG